MPTLMQHSQHVQPSLTSLESAPLANPTSQRSSSMPTTTDSSKASWLSMTETRTMQQLALMLGRKGLEHAAISMQQHQPDTQHHSNLACPSRLSWELLSSMSWLPSWCKHQASASGHLEHHQASAVSGHWHATDHHAVEREVSTAQQQRMDKHLVPRLGAVTTKEPWLYTMHMPDLPASTST